METGQLIGLFTVDPVVAVRTGIRFFHFIGLALGLGGAVILDLMLLRFFIRGKIIQETFGIFDFASKVVGLGLRILWITGIGFLFVYALTSPDLLTNPKVHAKLVIVAILTVNGYIIHSVILPGVKAQIGKSLFTDVGPLKRTIFITSGSISAVSWFFPVALGAFPQLNFSVPALTILSVYLGLMALAAIGMHAIIHLIDRIARPAETDPGITAEIQNDGAGNIFAQVETQTRRDYDHPQEQTATRRLIIKPRISASQRNIIAESAA